MKPKTALRFAALATVPFIMVLGNSMLIPVLPTIKSVLGLTQTQVGLLITAFSVPAGIAIAFAGFLSDRLGRKAVIAPALIIYGIGGLLAGAAALFLAKPYLGILGGRVIQGIGAAGTAPVAMALAGDIFQSKERSKALGLLEASNGLGKVVSPVFGALAALITWFTPFFAYAILAFPAAVMIWFLVKEPEADRKGTSIKQYLGKLGRIFENKGVSLGAAFFAGSVVLFTLFGVLFFLSDLLEKRFGIDGLPKGGLLAIPVLAMATTSYLSGAALQKRNNLMKAAVVAGLVLGAAAMAVVPFFFSKTVVFFLAIILVGVGNGLVLPALNTLITSSAALTERGMVTSAYGAVRFFGVAGGPPVFGALMGSGPFLLFLASAGLIAAAAIVAFLFIDDKRLLAGDKEGPEKDKKLHKGTTHKTDAKAGRRKQR